MKFPMDKDASIPDFCAGLLLERLGAVLEAAAGDVTFGPLISFPELRTRLDEHRPSQNHHTALRRAGEKLQALPPYDDEQGGVSLRARLAGPVNRGKRGIFLWVEVEEVPPEVWVLERIVGGVRESLGELAQVTGDLVRLQSGPPISLQPLVRHVIRCQRPPVFPHPFLPDGPGFQLSSLYVERNVSRVDSSADEVPAPVAEETTGGVERGFEPRRRELEAAALVEGSRTAVLFGDPGSGKSTLLTGLAHRLAVQAAARPFRIPFLVRLGFAGPVLASLKDSILHHVIETELGVADPERWPVWQELLDGLGRIGLLVFLLDGLDEAVSQEEVRTWIQPAVAALERHHRIVISSRRAGFQRVVDDFDTYEMVDLDEAGIVAFIANWFAFVAAREEDFVRALTSWVLADDRLRGFSQNPYLLSLLCYRHQRDPAASLIAPLNRAHIYQDAIGFLREDHHARTGREFSSEAFEALTELAYRLFTRPEPGPTFSIDDVRSAAPPGAADRWVEHLRSTWTRSGILARPGSARLLAFLHLTLQEWLVARWLTGQPLEEVRRCLDAHGFRPSWRTVWHLYAGLCRLENDGRERFRHLAAFFRERQDLGGLWRLTLAELCTHHGGSDAAALLGLDLRPELLRHLALLEGGNTDHWRVIGAFDPDWFAGLTLGKLNTLYRADKLRVLEIASVKELAETGDLDDGLEPGSRARILANRLAAAARPDVRRELARFVLSPPVDPATTLLQYRVRSGLHDQAPETINSEVARIIRKETDPKVKARLLESVGLTTPDRALVSLLREQYEQTTDAGYRYACFLARVNLGDWTAEMVEWIDLESSDSRRQFLLNAYLRGIPSTGRRGVIEAWLDDPARERIHAELLRSAADYRVWLRADAVKGLLHSKTELGPRLAWRLVVSCAGLEREAATLFVEELAEPSPVPSFVGSDPWGIPDRLVPDLSVLEKLAVEVDRTSDPYACLRLALCSVSSCPNDDPRFLEILGRGVAATRRALAVMVPGEVIHTLDRRSDGLWEAVLPALEPHLSEDPSLSAAVLGRLALAPDPRRRDWILTQLEEPVPGLRLPAALALLALDPLLAVERSASDPVFLRALAESSDETGRRYLPDGYYDEKGSWFPFMPGVAPSPDAAGTS